ncbi:MAG: VWA domain-containing protein [Clostridia bacterium]|nr:VWA domain-containing protein [Clostridia bacterium]
MNLLNQIIIDGKICLDYAFLSAEYQFAFADAESKGVRYFFPVPEGGQVTGLQLMDDEGRLMRGEISSLREESLKDAGLSLVRISPCLYCLTIHQKMQVCRVLVQMLLPLKRQGNQVRFVFPSGMETGKLWGEKNRCRIQMNLELESGQASSLHHAVACTQQGISAEFESGADFVLDMTQPLRQSTALIQENRDETVGIYRLCPKMITEYRKNSYKRVMLLLDTTGTADEKRFAQVRELFLRILQALPGDMVVQAIFAGAPRSLILPSFMSVGETLTQILFQALKVCPRGGNLREMLENLPEDADEETLVILVSSGLSRELYRPLNSRIPIHLFTVGTVEETPLAEFWNQTGTGTHHHCYPGENLTQRTRDRVNWLFSCCSQVDVIPQDAVVQEWYMLNRDLAADGYMDVAIRFFGAPPQTFLLRHRNQDKEYITTETITVYSHLPMASQLFASAKVRQLTWLLSKVDVSSVPAIKEEIEKIAISYGILSSETMFALACQGERIAVPAHLVLAPVEDVRPTVFGERIRTEKLSIEQKKDCMAVLLSALHVDGSVCERQIADKELRKLCTAWAIIGFAILEDSVPDFITEKAVAYLHGWTPDGILGELYQTRETLMQFLHDRRQRYVELWADVTQPDSVVSAVKLLIKMT